MQLVVFSSRLKLGKKKNISDKKWIPPPMHELKCNIGAAWSRKNLWAGVLWVVRDNKGLCSSIAEDLSIRFFLFLMPR